MQESDHRKTFLLYLVKPSHYDDDGYVIQWLRSEIPSNTLAALHGIAQDCNERRALGDDIDIEIVPVDETNTRIRPRKIAKQIKASSGGGLVALVGVQSNQYPRAIDIARPLRELNVPVCIGGFHASGSLAMLPGVPPEVQQAWDMGISIFAGEAEGRLELVLQDCVNGELKPLYNYLLDLPGLEGVPKPILPKEKINRNMNARTSFDSGRGCPFQCSFCTIINVQGRKSRYRTADDVEEIIRRNAAQGVTSYFITDDNFARNRNWEMIFDRLIDLRENHGIKLKLIIQVDTLCHLIKGFVEKAGRAGVKRVFIGLENINPDNLQASKKKQNRITEYRKMLLDWKSIGAITYCGYILGFPNDTTERILRDIEIIKRELPIDLLEFFKLTPLPGSEDHKVLAAKGAWMEPDLNKYDLEHVCAKHETMSDQEYRDIYRKAWDAYYTPEHVMTLMRRAVASGTKPRTVMRMALWFYGCHKFEGVHPLQGGYFRRKYRRDRRHGLPIENPLVFYAKLVAGIAVKYAGFAALASRYYQLYWRLKRDPERFNYTDTALSLPEADEFDDLEIYRATESAAMAVQKAREMDARRASRVAAE